MAAPVAHSNRMCVGAFDILICMLDGVDFVTMIILRLFLDFFFLEFFSSFFPSRNQVHLARGKSTTRDSWKI